MKMDSYFDILLGIIMFLSGIVFFTPTIELWKFISIVTHTVLFYISLYLTENRFSYIRIEEEILALCIVLSQVSVTILVSLGFISTIPLEGSLFIGIGLSLVVYRAVGHGKPRYDVTS